ncbi:hypothetical protein PILCRDRAFT_16258 [Piloderma croceum F 1598]|uniref:Uncharacterized protein n=1 Tax=Piloderma croceum (strain F 1598) TaxID=765440 RepID=A0A0C3AET7_PILCF|nr:hypothetical protein PILCRDRAFT_16258 [Piloderma croceum F 1598]
MTYKGRPRLSTSSDGQESPYVPRYGPPPGRGPPDEPPSDNENLHEAPLPPGGPPPPGGPTPPPGLLPLGLPGPPLPPAPPPPPNPPAPTPATPPAGLPIDKRKSHVKKPDDFTESKQWDHFNVIHFLLSFMMEGLPEKFAANFIDNIVEDWEQRKTEAHCLFQPIPSTDWGTLSSFQEKCELTFGDQNKKSSAKHQLALLKQGTRTAEEYFQEFNQLV